jgi:outer membrane protein OmpA-like peptidoglycan-associated protein
MARRRTKEAIMPALRSVLMWMRGAAAGLAMAGVAGVAAPAAARETVAPKRSVLAITYPEGSSTSVDLVGSTTDPAARGTVDVKRQDGRTRIHVHLQPLPHPQSLGSFYTTYVLWAVAPEGQAENLAELPYSKKVDLELTTAFPTFGLIVTAEPHFAVALPSPAVVAENTASKSTEGILQSGRISYGGSAMQLYRAASPEDFGRRDYKTPLALQGAHNAVTIARSAGAAEYASEDLRTAEAKLAMLDRVAMKHHKLSKEDEAEARDVMRLAEHARSVAVQRSEEAARMAERSAASARVSEAQLDAERARREAERAQASADQERGQAASARADALLARERAEAARDEAQRAQARIDEEQKQSAMARSDAERARVNEEAARADAARAREDADEARRASAQAQQQLYQSLSAILETRREARGLIVNLSDVLFDFGRASLTPGAREKLSKLAGVLLAYPGSYRMSAEGHTDSVGSDDFNQRLSEDRARSALEYLVQAGVPRDRVGSPVGFGKTRPVASNDSAAGRQMNRRVELVISDLEH